MNAYGVVLTDKQTGERFEHRFPSRSARSSFRFDARMYSYFFIEPDMPDNKYDDSFDVSSAA